MTTLVCHSRLFSRPVGFAGSLVLVLCMTAATTVAQADELPVSFAREILPILSDKCFACHGPDTHDADQLRLDSLAAATQDRGGYRAIDAQTPAKSELLKRIHDADNPMPPADAERQLTVRERELLSRWIKQGGEYETHWAYVPPKKTLPAGITNEQQGDGSAVVDAFITRQLKSKDIEQAEAADKPTLARRVALVLTGLPPEPGQLQRYLSDDSDSAYPTLVEELLASPRFGEHQARYWLDAVRYGDTHGLHLDNRRGIYPYRDWVVRAFNRNQPLDEFIIWQLAGDMLPAPTLEQLVATGFVRMNPSTSEGGVIPAEFQAKNNFDRVETLGTVFLGMSLTCARCHTHKYDPVTHTDYYRLLAFFNSTAESPLDGNKYEYGPIIKAPADQLQWERWTGFRDLRERFLQNAADRLKTNEELPANVVTAWQSAAPEQQLQQLADPKHPLSVLPVSRRARQLQQLQNDLQTRFTTTLIARELPKPRETKLLQRGEYDQPAGDVLTPEALPILGPLPADSPRNRLGLARWLVSREHPLTARVLINRIWQRTFGHGLVRTPEDFGLQGRQATHPELLDWLAVELQDSGWDLKQTLRMLVLSRTFQQSAAVRKGVEDPENRLFARGPSYRLDAEVIRDMALWAGGVLDETAGGEGVKPYQPEGLWSALAHPASNTKKYVPDAGEKINRRSLYVYWKRTSPHPMMTLFDAPSRESSCVRRSRTNTSLQSLGLLNETQRIDTARAFAARLLTEHDTDANRLEHAFRLLTCRPPTGKEQQACEQLLATMRERFQQTPADAAKLLGSRSVKDLNAVDHAAWTQLTATLLASDLAITLY